MALTSPLTARQSLALTAILLGVTAAMFAIALALGFLLPHHLLLLLTGILVVHGIAMITTIHIALRRAGTSWRALGFEPPTWRLLHLLWQVPLLLVTLIVVQGLVLVVTGQNPAGGRDGIDSLISAVGTPAIVLIVIAVVALAPIWEEAAFRGVIFGAIRRRWSTSVAVLGSAALFAIMHGAPILLAYMATAGVGFALLRVFHRSLWGSVLAHMVLNGVATSVTLVTLLS
ncbi:MAG: lysostaphin resistance A-like protein [Beutenbergiaceae bacterium]